MGMVGADAAALLRFVGDVRRRRAGIQDAMARLGRLVAEAEWVGPDRERFVAEWHGTHRPSLDTMLADLEQAASTAAQHAEAQQEASS